MGWECGRAKGAGMGYSRVRSRMRGQGRERSTRFRVQEGVGVHRAVLEEWLKERQGGAGRLQNAC